ncbi:hypothetical protein ACS0TY_033649 [Phlomoides rotata]
MAVISSNPSFENLKITFHESTLVFTSQETEKRSFFLSNIDQMVNYNVPTFYFFFTNPGYPPEQVSKRLKLVVQRVLVPYDFMAGRLKLNEESGCLEINCNAAGAGFVVASSEFSLDEIGDLVCPNVGFQQLAVQTLQDNLGPNKDDHPLFILQVTSFRCGGFAIGMSVNHIMLDGFSAKGFNENLASQAFDDKPLVVVPFHDRRLLAARSPPHMAFQHLELFKPDITPVSGPPVFDCNDRRGSKNQQPQRGGGAKPYPKTKCTTRRESPLSLRPRLIPPLPATYCGNPLHVAYATAKCQDIEDMPFSAAVKMVAEAPARVTEEYAKSVIDWLEINNGLPHGEYMVSSWLKLGFEEVEFPWGKNLNSGSVVNHRKDICWIFPTGIDGGDNALVSLPPPEMQRFESHFHQFYNSDSH